MEKLIPLNDFLVYKKTGNGPIKIFFFPGAKLTRCRAEDYQNRETDLRKRETDYVMTIAYCHCEMEGYGNLEMHYKKVPSIKMKGTTQTNC